MSISKALNALSDMIAQHQREFESLAKMFQMKDSLSSSSYFSDGASNSTYKVQRDNDKLTIVSTKNNLSVTVVVPLPLTSDSKVEVTSVDSTGAPTTKSMSFSEYVKGFEVPTEVKDMYSKVVKTIGSLFPTLSESHTGDVNSKKTDEKSTVTQPTVSEQSQDTAEPAAEPADPVYTEYVLPRTDSKYLKFEGELLYSVATSLTSGRNKEFYLFKTKSGKFVVQEKKKSIWPGEQTISEVVVLESKHAVLEDLYNRGRNRLVQDVVSRLNWYDDYVESVD